MMILTSPNLVDYGEFDEVVYLAAPIHTFYEPEYEQAIEIIQKRHPEGVLLPSRTMFSDSLDFVLTYRDKLLPVDTLYVLPDRNFRVGAGVYAEWEYLMHVSPNCKEILTFFRHKVSPHMGVHLYGDFGLEPLDPEIRTMREFARVDYF